MVELIDLGKLGSIFCSAADSLGKLAESIAKMAQLSTQGYDALATRREQARLRELSRRSSSISASNIRSVDDLSRFLSSRHFEYLPPEGRELYWQKCPSTFEASLAAVDAFIHKLESESGDFVFQEAYREMVSNLEVRRALILRLATQTAPETRHEIDAVAHALKDYERLRVELIQARISLAEYADSVGRRKPVRD